MKKIGSLLVLCFSFTFCFAQQETVVFPELKLTASGIEVGDIEQGKNVSVGDVITVGLKLPEFPPDKQISVSTLWEVKEFLSENGKVKEVKKKVKFDKNTNSVTFGTGVKPTELYVECIATWLAVVTDKDGKFVTARTETIKQFMVINIGQLPQPPPPVNPNVPVNIPDGKFGVGKKIYDIAERVDPKYKKDVLNVFVKGGAVTINEITASKFFNAQELLNGWRANNKEAAVNYQEASGEILKMANEISVIMEKLSKESKLKTIDDYRTFIWEMMEVLGKANK